MCQDISFDAPHGQHTGAFPDCSDPDGDGFTVHVNPGRTVRATSRSTPYATSRTQTSPAPTASRSTRATPSRTAAPRRHPYGHQRRPRSASPGAHQQTLRTGKPIDAARLLLRHRRRPGHDQPLDARITARSAPSPTTRARAPTRRPTRPPAPTRARTTSPSPPATASPRSPSYGFDLTITAEPRAAVRSRTGPSTPRSTAVALYLLLLRRGRAGPGADLHAGRRPGPGARHPRCAVVDFQVDYTPTPASAARTASRSARPTARWPTPTTRSSTSRTRRCAAPRRPSRSAPARAASSSIDCTCPNDDVGPLQYEIGTQPTKGTLSPSGTSFNNFRTYTAGPGADGRGLLHDPPHRLDGLEPVRHAADHHRRGDQPRARLRRRRLRFRQIVYSGRPASCSIFCADARRRPAHVHGRRRPGPRHELDEQRPGHATPATPATSGFDEVPYTASDGHGGSIPAASRSTSARPSAPDVLPGPDRGDRAARQDRPAAARPAPTRRATRRPTRTPRPPRARSAASTPIGARHLHGERGRERDRHVHDARRPTRSATATRSPSRSRSTRTSTGRRPARRTRSPEARRDGHGEHARPRRRLQRPRRRPAGLVRQSDPATAA